MHIKLQFIVFTVLICNHLNKFYSNKEFFFERPQTHKGVKVFGSRIVQHYEGDVKKGEINHTYKIKNLKVIPSVTKDEAKELANYQFDLSSLKSELVIYPHGKDNKAHLAWHLQEESYTSRMNLFIDAHTGKLLQSYNQMAFSSEVTLEGSGALGDYRKVLGMQDDKGQYHLKSLDGHIQTYEFHVLRTPGRSIASENAILDDHPEALDAHYFTEKVSQVFKDRFQVESIGNSANKLISTVNYIQPGDAYFPHSFWNGSHIVYGRGGGDLGHAPSGALDLVAHEITHTVIERSSNLVYSGESGALNESLCDIMGTYMEYKITPDKFDWKFAEDTWTPKIPNDALRYMDNPGKDGKSADHYSTRYTGYADNGGVHRNSGISNLAFYLFSEGGHHPTKPGPYVQGVGIETATDIFFKAYTQILAPRASFKSAREATLYIARSYGENVISSLKSAWLSVGIGPVPGEDGNPPPRNDGQDNGDNGDDDNGQINQEVLVEKDIPDNNRSGVTSQVNFSGVTDKVEVYVLVEHTYKGDLEVRVKSPQGNIYTLHKQEGGSANNINKAFTVKLSSSKLSQGLWKINVRDLSSQDKGKFIKWSIK